MNREVSLVTWKDVRADVLEINKELGTIIDAIDPDDSYKFVKASYLYGDVYVKNGEVQVPVNNQLMSLSDLAVDKNIQNELHYSSIPLLLGLEKNSEFFVNAGKRIIPVNLFHKGELYGTYETMDYLRFF
jgi:hypothetical protein